MEKRGKITIVIVWVGVHGAFAMLGTLYGGHHGVGHSFSTINVSRVTPIAFNIVSF
jgi:hypothetical protein